MRCRALHFFTFSFILHTMKSSHADLRPGTTRPCKSDFDFLQTRALCHYEAAKRMPLYAAILEPLAARFGLTERDVRHHFLRYNLGINIEKNDTYLLLGTQFAQFVNYLPNNTWFSRRLDRYSRFVKRFEHVLDVGFGIPLPWRIACAGDDVVTGRFTLLDSSESALDFAAEFIAVAKRRFPRAVDGLEHNLVLGSIEKSQVWSVVRPQTVVALDCIEHSVNASRCLRRIVDRLHGSTFLVALPVGTSIPQHTIDFDTEEDAVAFVRGAGLTVQDTHLVESIWDGDVVGNFGFKGSIFVEAV